MSAPEIREKYSAKYPVGVCSAIRNIVGDSEFARLFGAATPEEALTKCIEAGRDNAGRYIDKWLRVWPTKMAQVFKLT